MPKKDQARANYGGVLQLPACNQSGADLNQICAHSCVFLSLNGDNLTHTAARCSEGTKPLSMEGPSIRMITLDLSSEGKWLVVVHEVHLIS